MFILFLVHARWRLALFAVLVAHVGRTLLVLLSMRERITDKSSTSKLRKREIEIYEEREEKCECFEFLEAHNTRQLPAMFGGGASNKARGCEQKK